LKTSPVVIISGLTGCGKSTQVPQFLFDAHPNSCIAVCEPRRLAATSLARRVCEERSSKCGYEIGYQIGMESKRG
jgi:HrpA-like RNA helicase